MIKGVDKVLRNLNSEIGKIKTKSIAGLMAGGLIVQAGAQKRVPVEYGNLRGSAYTRRAQNNPMAVEVGFGAEYALFVHENMEMKWQGKPRRSKLGVYWGPAGESQFLLKAVRDSRDRVIDIIKKHSEVGR
jgi:hypothetical protein